MYGSVVTRRVTSVPYAELHPHKAQVRTFKRLNDALGFVARQRCWQSGQDIGCGCKCTPKWFQKACLFLDALAHFRNEKEGSIGESGVECDAVVQTGPSAPSIGRSHRDNLGSYRLDSYRFDPSAWDGHHDSECRGYRLGLGGRVGI